MGVAVAIALVPRGRRWTVAIVAVAAVAGVASSGREAATLGASLPEASAVVGTATSDGTGLGFALRPRAVWVSGEWRPWAGPRLWVRSGSPVEVGTTVRAAGPLSGPGFTTRFGPVAGALSARAVEELAPPPGWLAAGSALRHRVRSVFSGRGPGPSLVIGFLIGDTSGVPEGHVEALRRSGLSHFVAVSGSNVALVVGMAWIGLGLFVVDGRWRALACLVVLGLFVVATRWEPSVVRAGVMAAIVLGGRIGGWSVSAWSALGLAVAALVVVSPELTGNVGFQLSVAATVGVLVAARRRRGWVAATAAATIGAQIAVAPLLLAHFGEVPLLAPAANVVAAPLVTAATTIGAAAAVMGLPLLGAPAGAMADAVTAVASAFAGGPQLGVGGVAATGGVVALVRSRRWRPVGMAALAVVVVAATASPPPARSPEVVFLDVGQGDGILLRGGATILIDGGPHPDRIRDALRRYRIDRIDLAILTHPHSDHLTGLETALARVPVAMLWYPPFVDEEVQPLLALAAERGVAARTPDPGTTATIGPFTLEVLGPKRRYASLNDGSLVVAVSAGGPRLLASGDVEVPAQRELSPGSVDILKVPHQGAATSDLAWLTANAGSIAVISVGRNDFGHPSLEVIRSLEAGGALVLRTDREGDIRLPLSPLP